MKIARLFAVACALAASVVAADDRPASPAAEAAANTAEAVGALLHALRPHCGKAFAGRVLVDEPASPTSPFAGKSLVMHMRECRDDGIRIPLHVGDDRSRTWVLDTARGLRLKHDHRHADGSPDKVTMYGGDLDAATVTLEPTARSRLEFPVDAESVAMFRTNGLAASTTSTWAIEWAGDRFVYELSRPNGRLFRLEFDLSRPVETPPAPWGATP
ncbi:MAG: hypothetical protein ACOY82_03045 [Pseudomonadota bacterium]